MIQGTSSEAIGLCGGFQMLGRTITNPGIEGHAGMSEGLGWLDLHTTLRPEKQLRNVSGRLTLEGARVRGYEIHMGQSSGAALEHPLGTYVHGLFETPEACAALLRSAGLAAPIPIDHNQRRERSVRLALLPGIEPIRIEAGP